MDVRDYCTLGPASVSFDERGASDFAKGVAGDFNPIHDPGSKRFCVPGDLLFAVLLVRYGAFAETAVRFAGMLDAGVTLELPSERDGALHLRDPRGREILGFFADGRRFDDAESIAGLALDYVRFSGRTFPEILVPLMRDADVMINPERPLVIYKDMALRLEELPSAPLELAASGADLSVVGKKGAVRLSFAIESEGRRIGEGEKNLVLSGLRPFEAAAMEAVVQAYEGRRVAFERSREESGAL